MLLYYSDDADEIVDSTDIPDSFTFDPPTTIPFEAAVHSLDGTYLGNVDLTDGLLQLCETTESVANAAYIFGTYYSYSVRAINDNGPVVVVAVLVGVVVFLVSWLK